MSSNGAGTGSTPREPNSNTLLFNSASLRDLLGGAMGNTNGKGEKKRSRLAVKAAAQYSEFVQNILKEETGIVGLKRSQRVASKPSKKKKQASALSHISKMLEGDGRKKSFSKLDQARAMRLAHNNVFSFAAGLGMPHAETAYLEKQFQHVQDIVSEAERKIKIGFEQLVGRDKDTLLLDDAWLLMTLAGLEVDDKVFNKVCDRARVYDESSSKQKHEITSSPQGITNDKGNTGEEGDFLIETVEEEVVEMQFDLWLRGICSALRQQLMTCVLGERRGLVAPSYLESMSLSAKTAKRVSAFDNSLNNNDSNNNAMIGQPTHGKPSSPPIISMSKTVGMASIAEETLSGKPSLVKSKSGSAIIHPQASTMSKLPPVKIKQLQKKAAKKKLMKSFGFDDSFGRETPRCLINRADPIAGGSSVLAGGAPVGMARGVESVLATVDSLRRELRIAQEGLQQLNGMVDENIAWVHNNCDVVHSNVTISTRTKERCRKMAVEKLFTTISDYLDGSVLWALQRWRIACQYSHISKLAVVFARAKGIEGTCRVMGDALTRQYLRAWVPWMALYRLRQREEQEAACVEIQKIVYGFLGRVRVKQIRRNKLVIRIQSMFRCFKARRIVARKRKQALRRRINNCARRITEFFRNIVRKKEAKAEVLRRRRQRAAIKIQKIQRGIVGRARFKRIKDAKQRASEEYAARMRAREEAAAKAKAEKEAMLEAKRKEAEKLQASIKLREQASAKIAAGAAMAKGALGGIGRMFGGSKTAEETRGDEKVPPARTPSPPVPERAPSPIPSPQPSPVPERSPSPKPTSPIQSNQPTDPEPTVSTEATKTSEQVTNLADPDTEAASLKLQALARGGLARRKSVKLTQEKQARSIRMGLDMGSSVATGLSNMFGGGNKNKDKNKTKEENSPVGSGGGGGGGDGGGSRRPSLDGITTGISNFIRRPSLDGILPSFGSPSASQDKSSNEGNVPSPVGGGGGGGGGRKSPTSPVGTNEKASPKQSPTNGRSPSPTNMSASRQSTPPTVGPATTATLTGTATATATAPATSKSTAASPTESSTSLSAVKTQGSRSSSPLQSSGGGDSGDQKSVEKKSSFGSFFGSKEPKRSNTSSPPSTPPAASASSSSSSFSASSSSSSSSSPPSPSPSPTERKSNSPVTIQESNKSHSPKYEADSPITTQTQSHTQSQMQTTETDDKIEEEEDQWGTFVEEEEVPHKGDITTHKEDAREEEGEGDEDGDEEGSRTSVGSRASQERIETSEEKFARKMKEQREKEEEAAEIERQKAERAAARKRAEEEQLQKEQEEINKKLAAEALERKRRGEETPRTARSAFGSMFDVMSSAVKSSAELMKTSAEMVTQVTKKLATSPSPTPRLKRKGGPLPTPEIAVLRIQCAARCRRARIRVSNKRDAVKKSQKKAGLLIYWAVVTIQRIARGRQGRKRYQSFVFMAAKKREERILKLAKISQRIVRGFLGRRRVKKILKERQRKRTAAEFAKYNKDKGRRGNKVGKVKGEKEKSAVAAAASAAAANDEEDDDMEEGGISSEQAKALEEKIKRLEEIEASIKAREEAMLEAQRRTEEQAERMAAALKLIEERAAQEAARREVMEMAMGEIPSARSTGRSAKQSARGSGRKTTGRMNTLESARHSAPPTARSARGGAGIPPDAPSMMYEGEKWVQLWDPEESAHYWYCERTQAAQWDPPGTETNGAESDGYESMGGMTDYSTDAYSSGGEYDSDYGGNSEWQEFWDEQAQAKYWYNYNTGEATWARPGGSVGSSRGSAMNTQPAPVSMRSADWVSYLDPSTGQEYWYNAVTGESSW